MSKVLILVTVVYSALKTTTTTTTTKKTTKILNKVLQKSRKTPIKLKTWEAKHGESKVLGIISALSSSFFCGKIPLII